MPRDSPLIGQTVGELQAASEDDVEVLMILRGRNRSYDPSAHSTLKAGDILLLEGEPEELERLVAKTKLELAKIRTSRRRTRQ